MLPEKLAQRWEAAYRRYGRASAAMESSVAGDRDAAREMAASSWEVAAAWREMECMADMPWWALAALGAAAQAFEFQARDWNARAAHGWPSDDNRRTRSQAQLPARERPTCDPSRGEAGGFHE
jgi:hypothetical protein